MASRCDQNHVRGCGSKASCCQAGSSPLQPDNILLMRFPLFVYPCCWHRRPRRGSFYRRLWENVKNFDPTSVGLGSKRNILTTSGKEIVYPPQGMAEVQERGPQYGYPHATIGALQFACHAQ